jgi:hypothetical protein
MKKKSPAKETSILEMCPNLAKFLLGADKIWLKFAIEYLYSLFFWRSKFYTNWSEGGKGNARKRRRGDSVLPTR